MYTLGVYEKAFPDDLPLEQKFLVAQKVGYDFVELTIDQNSTRQNRLNWSNRERLDLYNFMHSQAIAATTLSLSALRDFPLGSSDQYCARRGKEMLLKAIDLANDLGCRIVLINAYDEFLSDSTLESEKRFLVNLDYCTRYASARGVIIGLENADKPFGDSIKKTLHWVNQIRSPYLKIYADIGNVTNAAVKHFDNPLTDLDFGCGCIAAVHLKDTLPGEYRFVRYGEGHVDFASCIRLLIKAGVGIYMAEMFDCGHADWENEVKYAHDFLRRHFSNIGERPIREVVSE